MKALLVLGLFAAVSCWTGSERTVEVHSLSCLEVATHVSAISPDMRRRIVDVSCKDAPWPLDVRRCMLAASSRSSAEVCMQGLNDTDRRSLLARLAAARRPVESDSDAEARELPPE